MKKETCTCFKEEEIMIPATTWNGPDEIRRGFDDHAPQLIDLEQEMEILDDWSGHLVGTLYSYDPLKDEIEFIMRDDRESFFVSISRIQHVTLLPSRKMTLRLAYSQMEEMQKYIGK